KAHDARPAVDADLAAHLRGCADPRARRATDRRRPLAGATGLARDTRAVGAVVDALRYEHRRAAVPGEAAVDSALQRLLRTRGGRHLAAADRAHRVHDRAG